MKDRFSITASHETPSTGKLIVLVCAALVGGVLLFDLCAAVIDNPGGMTASTAAYKLSVVDVSDGSEEAAFQDVINCIMSSGIEGAETEEKVGDVLVASWQQSGKKSSLLEWGQAICAS